MLVRGAAVRDQPVVMPYSGFLDLDRVALNDSELSLTRGARKDDAVQRDVRRAGGAP